MSYLSVTSYIAKFGERETILLTNTAPPAPNVTPTYDGPKVESAINDAIEVVEGYVGKRYRVPLDDPPRILIGFVAALAREALHVNANKVTEPVQLAADRVRSQLRDIAKGDMTLPLAPGQEEPGQQDQGYARTSGDRPAPVFGDGRLSDYLAPFTGGGDVACWRR